MLQKTAQEEFRSSRAWEQLASLRSAGARNSGDAAWEEAVRQWFSCRLAALPQPQADGFPSVPEPKTAIPGCLEGLLVLQKSTHGGTAIALDPGLPPNSPAGALAKELLRTFPDLDAVRPRLPLTRPHFRTLAVLPMRLPLHRSPSPARRRSLMLPG